MLIVGTITIGDEEHPTLTLVRGDSAKLKYTPIKDGQEYTMQSGDKLRLCVRKDTDKDSSILLDVYATDGTFNITAEKSSALDVGKYFYDVTLEYANGDIDTFTRIPTRNTIEPICNFFVTPGV